MRAEVRAPKALDRDAFLNAGRDSLIRHAQHMCKGVPPVLPGEVSLDRRLREMFEQQFFSGLFLLRLDASSSHAASFRRRWGLTPFTEIAARCSGIPPILPIPCKVP